MEKGFYFSRISHTFPPPSHPLPSPRTHLNSNVEADLVRSSTSGRQWLQCRSIGATTDHCWFAVSAMQMAAVSLGFAYHWFCQLNQATWSIAWISPWDSQCHGHGASRTSSSPSPPAPLISLSLSLSLWRALTHTYTHTRHTPPPDWLNSHCWLPRKSGTPQCSPETAVQFTQHELKLKHCNQWLARQRRYNSNSPSEQWGQASVCSPCKSCTSMCGKVVGVACLGKSASTSSLWKYIPVTHWPMVVKLGNGVFLYTMTPLLGWCNVWEKQYIL